MGTLVNDTTRSQLTAIRSQLETVGYIDHKTSLELCDCDALRSRISDLRNDRDDPMDIETVWDTKQNRYGHTVRYAKGYRLVREATT